MKMPPQTAKHNNVQSKSVLDAASRSMKPDARGMPNNHGYGKALYSSSKVGNKHSGGAAPMTTHGAGKGPMNHGYSKTLYGGNVNNTGKSK